MSIEDVTLYADIYSGNLTDKDMKYLDGLGVEWRGRNVLKVRDEVCIKTMEIFSKIYQQTARANPAALPQLKAEIIQFYQDLFVTEPEDEDEPLSLVYRFDPISGTYRETIAAEGFFKTCRKFLIPDRKHIKKALEIQQKITKPIDKVEKKVVEWAEEHPVAATVIGVAAVATLIVVLGPAGGPVIETVTAAAAASAAALTPEESDNDHRDKNKRPDSSSPAPEEALPLNPIPIATTPTCNDNPFSPQPNPFQTEGFTPFSGYPSNNPAYNPTYPAEWNSPTAPPPTFLNQGFVQNAPTPLPANFPNTPTFHQLNPVVNSLPSLTSTPIVPTSAIQHSTVNNLFSEGLTNPTYSPLRTDSLTIVPQQITQEPLSLGGRVTSALKDISNVGVSIASGLSHGVWNVFSTSGHGVRKGMDFIASKISIFPLPSDDEKQSLDWTKEGHTKIDEFFGTDLAYKYDPNYKPFTQFVTGEIPLPAEALALLGRVSQAASLDTNAVRTGRLASEAIKEISAVERARLATQEAGVVKNARLLEGQSTPITQVTRCYPDPKFAVQLEKQLENHGVKSILKSHNSIKQLLDEHKQKLPGLEFKSSVEREISTFEKQLDTLAQFAKENKISLE